jgi:hypothetical protein
MFEKRKTTLKRVTRKKSFQAEGRSLLLCCRRQTGVVSWNSGTDEASTWNTLSLGGRARREHRKTWLFAGRRVSDRLLEASWAEKHEFTIQCGQKSTYYSEFKVTESRNTRLITRRSKTTDSFSMPRTIRAASRKKFELLVRSPQVFVFTDRSRVGGHATKIKTELR